MSDIENRNKSRSEFLRNQNFDLDQIDLLARKLNESVEGVQMMIDGVADVPDEFARIIEKVLQKPVGYLDFDGSENQLDSGDNENHGDLPTPGKKAHLAASQLKLLDQFSQLSKGNQMLVAELIAALGPNNR